MTAWSLARALTAFNARLRVRGVDVSPAESAEALRALACIDMTDEPRFAAALRACLAKSPRDQERFDAVYADFWHIAFAEPAYAAEIDAEQADADDQSTRAVGEGKPAPASGEILEEDSDGPTHGASDQVRSWRVDLAAVDADEREAMQALIRTLGRRLAARAVRRWRWRQRGALDMRASLRKAIARGGELFELRRRLRRRERPRLVVLADVSYSICAHLRPVSTHSPRSPTGCRASGWCRFRRSCSEMLYSLHSPSIVSWRSMVCAVINLNWAMRLYRGSRDWAHPAISAYCNRSTRPHRNHMKVSNRSPESRCYHRINPSYVGSYG